MELAGYSKPAMAPHTNSLREGTNLGYDTDKGSKFQAPAFALRTDMQYTPRDQTPSRNEDLQVVQRKADGVQATAQPKGGCIVYDEKGLETEVDVTQKRVFENSKEPVLNSYEKKESQRPNLKTTWDKSNYSPVQRRVSPNRGKEGGYKSSETGLIYKTEEEARKADEAALDARQTLQEQERPPINFEFEPRQEGPPQPETELSEALLNNPVHFGQVMTTGGDVTAEQVNAYAQQQVIPAETRTAFSARNTHAMVFSQSPAGVNVHSHSGGVTSVNDISYATHPPLDFYREHSFMQGRPPAHVNLPDQRTTAHAEALAVNSNAFESAVDENASELSEMAEIFGFDPEIGLDENPTDEQLENLSMFLSVLPVKTTIALNRASCGHKGKSGHPGGCNQEMANSAQAYNNLLATRMDPSLAFLASQTGMATFGVSAAGPYQHQGNPSIMTRQGVNVDIHNGFDWRTGQGKPLSEEQQRYKRTAYPEESNERENKKRKEEKKMPRDEQQEQEDELDSITVEHPTNFFEKREPGDEGGGGFGGGSISLTS